jgi:ubiquinone/menaquinone biosynthesis C-methylase UbiE
MTESKIIHNESISDKANKKELYYRNNITLTQSHLDTVEKWEKRILDGRLKIIPQLGKKNMHFYGNILELGAGMCWFSSELSKISRVENVYALEFSEVILKERASPIMKLLNAKTEKITRVVGDFYNLKLKENYFDFIVFDASLHHVEHLEDLLKEIEKVMKKDGKIIAIREPVLPLLRKANRKTWGQEDKKYGVTELIFTMDEWKERFRKNGYVIKFVPYVPTNKILHKLIMYFPFSLLNNLLFGNYVFVIKKI